jgi:sporulation protein YlmC with PRC-barrel domain
MARLAMKDLKAMGVAGSGEPVGQVRDIWFDDRDWSVPYLRLATAQMMPVGHRALVPVSSIVEGSLEERSLRVPFTREQVEALPAPDDAMALHSAADLVGFPIHATDGDIGQVEDLVVDESAWKVTGVVVDTSKWLLGRKVVVPTSAVRGIDWDEKRVDVSLTRDELEHAPETA